ncbi:MAG: dynamin family protein, partial [Alloprevotella sp.]|nr:dynamin family protein [Alloprevotella sp.]
MSLINKPKAGVAQPVCKQIIQKSIYENPSVTLDLIAKICAAQPSNSQEDFYSRYRSVTDRLKDSTKQSKNNSSWNDSTANDSNSSSDYLIRLLKKSENASLLFNRNFSKDYQESLNEVVQLLEQRQSTNYIHVVLAGGFSSGKSSFLNRLVKNANLLPTGTQPISVVKTYLYCNAKNKKVTVEGVNLKNVLVELPTNVLQAIQHANSSNVHLASVLEKLLIQIKSSELDGLCFIDTPGYNNSISANVSNGKTDKDTATEAFAEGDVLFWLIDIDKGTAISDDIEMLAQFKGKPKVIIFNKADKKGYQESKKIVEEAYDLLPKYFDMNEIIDILAFSSLDNKILYSRHHTGLPGLLSDIRKRSHKSSPLNRAKQNIHNLFQSEICEQEEKIKQISDRIRLLKGEKDTAYRNQNRHQSDNEELIKDLKEAISKHKRLVTGYKDIRDLFDNFYDATTAYANDIIDFNKSTGRYR